MDCQSAGRLFVILLLFLVFRAVHFKKAFEFATLLSTAKFLGTELVKIYLDSIFVVTWASPTPLVRAHDAISYNK